ncbi:MAG: hypothetical protein KDA91_24770, partial [Planctomycetaceae bacterium]|nr:hypothetical protein [Planctomycetaceae bacterium]
GKTLKLLRVDTGTELASIDVTAVPEPRNLYLRPYRDQLVVLPEAVEDPSLDLDPVSEGLHVFGRMYAINRNGFQLAWDEPLGHYFLRSLKAMPGPILPSGPVMVLLARASQLREDGFARVSVYSAKVVDVRTGKDVDLGPEASNVGRALNYHWMKIFASEKRVELSFENRFFTLDYSREANSDASTQTE